MDSLEKEVLNAEASIKEQRDIIVRNVAMLSVLFILLFIATAVFIRLFQGRVVLRNLARLRHSLQLLVDSGEAHLLDIRNPHSEVGQLSTLVNTLLESQQGQKLAREHQLQSVSESLHAMIEQIDNIHHTTLQTRDNVQRSHQLMQELDSLAEQVRHTSSEVETYSRQTENSMDNSQSHAEAVRQASEETNQSLVDIRESIVTLNDNVDDVTNIIDMMKNIAEQTNLLSLNAAINMNRNGMKQSLPLSRPGPGRVAAVSPWWPMR